MGKVRITDEVQSVRTEVAKLKNAGVEFIIALGHSGLEMDRRVAREVDGVDAVVGGHSHSYLNSGKSIEINEALELIIIIDLIDRLGANNLLLRLQ